MAESDSSTNGTGVNFDRQYRLSIGPVGKENESFEIGETDAEHPIPPHISFKFEKSDLTTQNTGDLSVWNLSPEHLAVLEQKDCAVALKAGYGDNLSLIFAGIVSFYTSAQEDADERTDIEVIDNLIQIRDTYVTVSYNGKVNWKTIFDDTANQMGVTVSYSYNASFVDVSNGYSFVGLAKNILDKGCKCCGLSWSIQNGVLQIKKVGDVISKEAYVLSAETGLIGIPSRVAITEESDSKSSNTSSTKAKKIGWDVTYLMNAAITVDDYVKLESKKVEGYFRVQSVEISGDNVSGDWVCKARLLEVKG